MDADLAASGVPNPTVAVGAPAGVETELRRADQSAPMLRVTYRPPSGDPLTGLLPPLGYDVPLYTDTTGEEIVWDLAVIEAAKHVIAGGGSLAGLSITVERTGLPPELMIAALPEVPPEPQAAATLSPDQVQGEVQGALPTWAAAARVTVSNDAGGERVVELALDLPPSAFAALDVAALGHILGQKQIALAPLGGRIGRVIVRISDPVSRDPLYVAGHDLLYGHLGDWYAPIVRAYARPLLGAPADAVHEAGDVAGVDLPEGLP